MDARVISAPPGDILFHHALEADRINAWPHWVYIEGFSFVFRISSLCSAPPGESTVERPVLDRGSHRSCNSTRECVLEFSGAGLVESEW